MRTPWDQQLARVLVKPLARTPVTPNQITTLTLALALTGAGLFALGGAATHWGAALFVLARFLDHFDGELARLKGLASRFGYYYDYAAGGVSYAALFLGIGIGLRDSLGGWAVALGLAGAAAALAAMAGNIRIDDRRPDANPYPARAGFELEDGIYLVAPVTWLGLLAPFFVAAGLGAVAYCLWRLWLLRRLRRAGP